MNLTGLVLSFFRFSQNGFFLPMGIRTFSRKTLSWRSFAFSEATALATVSSIIRFISPSIRSVEWKPGELRGSLSSLGVIGTAAWREKMMMIGKEGRSGSTLEVVAKWGKEAVRKINSHKNTAKEHFLAED